MAEEVKVERNQNYVTFSLNRPEKRNAINRAVIEALDSALASIEADSDVRALVIRGEGRAFCSGLDLRDIEQMGPGGLRAEPAGVVPRRHKEHRGAVWADAV